MLSLRLTLIFSVSWIGFSLVAISAHSAQRAITVDPERNEIRLAGVIQYNPGRPAHSDWKEKSTAFVGSRGGGEEEDFVILLSARRPVIYQAARDLGWQTGRRYNWYQTFTRRGFSKRTDPTDFMTGDPLLCILQFEDEGTQVRIPLEQAIRARIRLSKKWVEVPYTPHWVFTGAGEENGIDSGCLVCPSDCVGGIMTDNSVPVMTEVQQFLVDWSMLPPPGEPVTVILRSIR